MLLNPETQFIVPHDDTEQYFHLSNKSPDYARRLFLLRWGVQNISMTTLGDADLDVKQMNVEGKLDYYTLEQQQRIIDFIIKHPGKTLTLGQVQTELGIGMPENVGDHLSEDQANEVVNYFAFLRGMTTVIAFCHPEFGLDRLLATQDNIDV